MSPDLAIDKNGNFVPTDGNFAIVVNNLSIRQLIYVALMDSPPNLIVGTQFTSVGNIQDRLRNYLNQTVGPYLPFPIYNLDIIAVRNEDESIYITIEFPNSLGAKETINQLYLTYDKTSGFNKQLDYIFKPLATPGVSTMITEIIELKKTLDQVMLNYDYSDGIVRIYRLEETPLVETKTVNFFTKEYVTKYDVYDILDLPNMVIDAVTILEGMNSVLSKAPYVGAELVEVPFEDGVPYIYLKPNITPGTLISLNITYSNSVSYSSVVSNIEDTFGEYVFGMKFNRNKSFAKLNTPIGPGLFKAMYYANIKHFGDINT